MIKPLLVEILREPQNIRSMEMAAWDAVVPQARNTGLLASLYSVLEIDDLLQYVPKEVLRHLESALWVHRKQREDLEYELKWLHRVTSEVGEQLILLKGAAYILGGLPAGVGRLVSDIDLLVPESRLGKMESALRDYGWESLEDDAYNDRYYRQWMHEIPPLFHRDRESVLDVHHTILPPTADEKCPPEKLFENLWEIKPGLFVLSPLDMVLHSATHLFHEGEFYQGLRDLWDLDRLLRFFAAGDEDFWSKLKSRATEMNMRTSIGHALRYCSLFFETPIPHALCSGFEASRSKSAKTRVMDFLFIRVLLPDHSSCSLPMAAFARFVVYVRSHYLRMPLYLLIPHLVRKAWSARFGSLFAATKTGEAPA